MKPASSRHQIRRLACLACLGFGLPSAALPQAATRPPRPPEAQAALDEGVIAAQGEDYLLAVRFFQDAHAKAPNDALILLDLGLAESRIPGRELRAIAWFGAYLDASPNASNAAVVKDQIARLDEQSKLNVSHLISLAQDAANHVSGPLQPFDLDEITNLWRKSGDFAAAMKAANLIQDAGWKSRAIADLATDQAWHGDIAEAEEAAKLIHDEFFKSKLRVIISEAKARAGDIAGAQETAALVHDPAVQNELHFEIARAQAAAGDIAEAQKTAILMQNNPDYTAQTLVVIAEAKAKAGDTAGARITLASALKAVDLAEDGSWVKSAIQNSIAEAQALAGDVTGARKTAALIQNAGERSLALQAIARNTPVASFRIQPLVRFDIEVSNWLSVLDYKLDIKKNPDNVNLNAAPFIDLPGYLTSQHSSDPQKLFSSLLDTAQTVVTAQRVVDSTLKQKFEQ